MRTFVRTNVKEKTKTEKNKKEVENQQLNQQRGRNKLRNRFQIIENFELFLRENWISIPHEVYKMKQPNLKNYEDSKKVKFAYGFQYKYSEKWFEWPFIIIINDESGKIDQSELENLENIRKDVNKGIKIAEKIFKGRVTNSNLGEVYYNSDSKILSSTLIAESIEQEKGISFIGSKLTNKGSIKFIGTSHIKESNIYLPFYYYVLENLTIHPSLRY